MQIAVDGMTGTTGATLTALLAKAAIRPAKRAAKMLDFVCAGTAVAERTNTNQPQEQASAIPETLHGLSADTSPNFPRFLFTIHARWLEQARAIRQRRPLMCRAAKSREGDHVAAAVGLRAQLEGFAPTIPDWANISTHSPVASLAVASIIFGRKARD